MHSDQMTRLFLRSTKLRYASKDKGGQKPLAGMDGQT